MRTFYVKSGFLFFLFLVLIEVSIAQENNPTEYPYGGKKLGELIFSSYANFKNAKFEHFTDFQSATFESFANFTQAKFNRFTNFSTSYFVYDVDFNQATFDSLADFSYTYYKNDASFWNVTFNGLADFSHAEFHNHTFFRRAEFHQIATFNLTTFDSLADFRGVKFHMDADFSFAKFQKGVDFESVTFGSISSFRRAVIKGEVSFRSTKFKEEIDFRQVNFDSVTVINLEGTKFSDGKFLFYWEQFKGKDSLRIKLKYLSGDSLKNEDYTQIEIIYHKLRDNFLAQGNESSADEVMYELGWQRKEILKEFDWQVYGTFFGYGYQPWRFLLFALLPIILIFAIIWYWFYYPTLVFIKSDLFPKSIQIDSKDKYLIKSGKFKLLKMRISDFTKAPITMNPLTRYWHALYFSTSVLLGIRFQKDWIKVFPKDMLGRKSYIRLVTFEWALGIILFVVFALLVKGIRFSFVKDLLGF